MLDKNAFQLGESTLDSAIQICRDIGAAENDPTSWILKQYRRYCS